MNQSSNLIIQGIPVIFPYNKPYDAQKKLMEGTIKAYSQAENALLESPTGTGKTMAILTSSLAYQNHDKDIKKIYYSSRTHTQLKQAVNEYKKYSTTIKWPF